MNGCEWFQVYDIIEEIYVEMAEHGEQQGEHDAEGSSRKSTRSSSRKESAGSSSTVTRRGVRIRRQRPWQGSREVWTADGRESPSRGAAEPSRRPMPDLPDAIYHGMGALEAVARDLSGGAKATLGEGLKRNPRLLPKPLDTALSQVWATPWRRLQ